MKFIDNALSSRVFRFLIVGVSNTAFNFLILNIAFIKFHQGKIASSIIATSCAIILSFYLNRNFVFRHEGTSWRQPIIFMAVTISGVMLIQNTIYALCLHGLQDNTHAISNLIFNVTSIRLSKDFLDVNLSNVVAAIGAMVWNYNGYKWLVFKGSGDDVIQIDLPG